MVLPRRPQAHRTWQVPADGPVERPLRWDRLPVREGRAVGLFMPAYVVRQLRRDAYAIPSSAANPAKCWSAVQRDAPSTSAEASRCASIQPTPLPYNLCDRTKVVTSV